VWEKKSGRRTTTRSDKKWIRITTPAGIASKWWTLETKVRVSPPHFLARTASRTSGTQPRRAHTIGNFSNFSARLWPKCCLNRDQRSSITTPGFSSHFPALFLAHTHSDPAWSSVPNCRTLKNTNNKRIFSLSPPYLIHLSNGRVPSRPLMTVVVGACCTHSKHQPPLYASG
jgi:hypothetical protein